MATAKGPVSQVNDFAIADPGSFRDPSGHIFHSRGRVFRTISSDTVDRFRQLETSGVLHKLIDGGRLWPSELLKSTQVPNHLRKVLPSDAKLVLEHPPLPYISYPYEWPFSLLKRAALLHIDLHLQALEQGFNLVDGSAYNVQFVGTDPVFIDTLSLVPLKGTDFWLGYQQFCTQFLSPLVLSAKCGIPYNAWYRGSLEGIDVGELARLVPARHKYGWGIFIHIILHAMTLAKARQHSANVSRQRRRGLSKEGLKGLLRSLRKLIAKQTPKGLQNTVWREYELKNSYASDEAQAKRTFVAEFASSTKPPVLWDLGCNSGEYSEVALAAGATRAIGFDFDLGALEAAVSRADDKKLDLLPLHLDATNPSPNQGWAQAERMGLTERAKAQGVIALALLHHLVIGKNIPMTQAVKWIVDLAPNGIIEFVPKADPMVQVMLSTRDDIFSTYDIDVFRKLLSNHAAVVKEEQVSESGRSLFWFSRK